MNEPDLGELEIVSKPLVIHEARAGGRRLTKALFLQLPDWTDTHHRLITSDCPPPVAWVNHHWTGCDSNQDRYSYATFAHLHILFTDANGKPFRGVVWEGADPQKELVCISGWSSDERGKVACVALSALVARKKMRNEGGMNPNSDDELRVDFNGRHVVLDCSEVLADGLRYDDLGQKHRENFVKTARLQDTEEALTEIVDDYITTEDAYRKSLRVVWELVTMETPQAFL